MSNLAKPQRTVLEPLEEDSKESEDDAKPSKNEDTKLDAAGGTAVSDDTVKKTRTTKRRRKNRARAREKSAMLMATEEFEAAFAGALSQAAQAGYHPLLTATDSGSPTYNLVDDSYPLDPDELVQFLQTRPSADDLKAMGILRDPEEREAKRLAVASELSKRLQHRPSQAELLDRHVIHHNINADPSLTATLDAVARQQTIDHLSRRLRDRVTIDELSKRGITIISDSAEPYVSQDSMDGAVVPQVLDTHVGSAHGARPSLHDLLSSRLIKDVMMWTKIDTPAHSAPIPRNCHTATVVDTQLVVIGGFTHPECTCQPIFMDLRYPAWYSPPTYSAAGVMPPDRYAHSAVNFKNHIVIFGGYGEGRWLNDVWVLDMSSAPALNTSSGAAVGSGVSACRWFFPPVHSTPPRPRAAHTAVLLGDDMIVFGGNDGSGLFDDVIVLKLMDGAFVWTVPFIMGTPPSARSGHTAVLYGSQMIVFGGGKGWGAECFNDLYILDCNLSSQSCTWVRPSFTGTPPSARTGHAACLIDHKMLVFGGGDAKRSFNDLHILDLRTMAWTRPSDTGALPVPRAGHTLSAFAPYIILFGGASPDGTCFNDLVVLDTEYKYVNNNGNSHKIADYEDSVSREPERRSPSLQSTGEHGAKGASIKGSAFRQTSPGSGQGFAGTTRIGMPPTSGDVSVAHADAKHASTRIVPQVASLPSHSIPLALSPASIAASETGDVKDSAKPVHGRIRGSRVAEIASQFMGPQRSLPPPKPLPGRLGISWPPKTTTAGVSDGLPAPVTGGRTSASSPSMSSVASIPTYKTSSGAPRKFSTSEAAQAAASGDPIAALSFVRSLLAAQHSEDESRYRQMQQALEDWKIQRQQQMAAIARVLDRITSAASVNPDFYNRLPHPLRNEYRSTPTPSSVPDTNPSGTATPEKRG